MGSYLSRREPPAQPQVLPLMETDWRKISWGQSNDLKEKLRRKPKDPSVKCLRILMVGPVQAGKSSFVHSIHSIFKNKIGNSARRVATGGKTFTNNYMAEKITDDNGELLPFVIGDVMGLERGEGSGVHLNDIINLLQGHIKDEYTFIPSQPCSKDDKEYNGNPTLKDKIHCLVFTIPICNFIVNSNNETNVLLSRDHIKKMQTIRRKASDLKIPQMVVLTKVDQACPHVKKDIKQVYRSQAIERKVKACSETLGIPKNCIFPVKNYSDEIQLDPEVTDVLLFTLGHILDFAHDFVEKMMTMSVDDQGDSIVDFGQPGVGLSDK